jgi:hypothetical protein
MTRNVDVTSLSNYLLWFDSESHVCRLNSQFGAHLRSRIPRASCVVKIRMIKTGIKSGTFNRSRLLHWVCFSKVDLSFHQGLRSFPRVSLQTLNLKFKVTNLLSGFPQIPIQAVNFLFEPSISLRTVSVGPTTNV